MRISFFVILIISFLSAEAQGPSRVLLSQDDKNDIKQEIAKFDKLPEGKLDELFSPEVISSSDVSSKNQFQTLGVIISGIHPKNCQKAMRKLSLYENYSTYMDFIKNSSYDENKQEIFFFMDHALMPFAMTLKFNLPRIKKEGHYPFTFKEGFLKDLVGTIFVKDINTQCLLGLKADWKGQKTPIPNIVFETFLETVGKIALEHLIRVSLF
jgi:hypothetical protein